MNKLKITEVKEKPKVNKRQDAFCKEYILNGWNATQAAIKAGYSKKNADVIAAQNLVKVSIQEHIKYLQANIELTTGISKEKIITALAEMAFSSMGDFKENWMKLVEYESLTREQKACIQEIENDIKVVKTKDPKSGKWKTQNVPIVRFKLYSRTAAIDIINKMLGYYSTGKLDITSGGKPIEQNITHIEIIKTAIQINNK